jgi:uncharacterized coiled-coil DUF342 family protein
MTDLTQATKLITAERDQARKEADELKRDMLTMQNEMAHLRHFKAGVQRMLRNMPEGVK